MGREQLVFNFLACKIIQRIEPASCDLMNELCNEALQGVPRSGRARQRALATPDSLCYLGAAEFMELQW